jgi:hypothetical protein
MPWLQSYRHHWSLLRLETERIGAEVEQWPYHDLHRSAEDQPPIQRLVVGMPTYFQVDCYHTRPNGDLAICIDAHGGPPTLLGIKPSYRFFKCRDGEVYY